MAFFKNAYNKLCVRIIENPDKKWGGEERKSCRGFLTYILESLLSGVAIGDYAVMASFPTMVG